MGIADEVLPPDRADQAPVTAPLRELLRHLQRSPDRRPSIEIVCEPDAYAQLRTHFARPFRPQPSTFCLPLGEGIVWFRRQSTDATYGAAQTQTDVPSAPVDRLDDRQLRWQAGKCSQCDLPIGHTGSCSPTWLERKAAAHAVTVEAMDGRVGAFVCGVSVSPAVIDDTPAGERADYGGAWKEQK